MNLYTVQYKLHYYSDEPYETLVLPAKDNMKAWGKAHVVLKELAGHHNYTFNTITRIE